MHTHLLVNIFSFLLGRHLEVDLLSHLISVWKLSKKLTNCFPNQLSHFIFLPIKHEVSNFSISFQHLLLYIFLIMGNLLEIEIRMMVTRDYGDREGMVYFIYPSVVIWCSFGLLLLFAYYEQCCSEHSCTSFYMDIHFHSSWVYT